MIWAFWALVGWCGTRWPGWWRFPPPPPPPPGDPWFSKIAGIVGGIAGGWLYNLAWPMGADVTSVAVAATAVGAFIGAVVLGDLVGLATGGRKA